jgi:hypothetical protein
MKRPRPEMLLIPSRTGKRRMGYAVSVGGVNGSRRDDDDDEPDPPPTLRTGNNQYGAIGTNKCYQCRIKKFRVNVYLWEC